MPVTESKVVMDPQTQPDAELSPEDMKLLFPSKEAGAVARERIQARGAAYQAARALKLVMGGFILFFLLGLAGIAVYGWETRVTATNIDLRRCIAKVGEMNVTGTRTFDYPYTEIFGFRFIDTGHIIESTRMNLNGNAITVVGQLGDSWWAIPIGAGEQGNQLLKPADNYTFVIEGKHAGVVEYNSFCR